MTEEEKSWTQFLEDGRAFRRTARGAQNRLNIFTPEIRLNIIGMAIEKYLMAFFVRHRNLPDNHTMHDLVAGMDRIEPLPADVRTSLFEMDGLQQICSPDEFEIHTPTEEEITRFLSALETVAAITESELGPCAT